MSVATGVSPGLRGLPAGLPRLAPVDRRFFADGLRTSGQHPPIDSQLSSFDQFPKRITGRTVWTPDEMADNPDKWIHKWTPSELAELERAVDAFTSSGEHLVNISKTNFPLPGLTPVLDTARDDILNGRGFILFRGLPIDTWGRYRAAVATMGISVHFGYLLSQNKLGLILGHVTNQGVDYKNNLDKIKISASNAPQFYHTDETDIVGLLFCAPGETGGASGCASAHTVWNELVKERPDVAKTLSSPIWYVDRKGEITDGQEPWFKNPIFFVEPGGKKRVYVKWDPYFVKSLSRFSDKGLIPPLSNEQKEAMEVLEACCQKNGLVYDCELGDIQFVSCCQTFHSRTGFTDPPAPKPPRCLLRTWIGTPEHEGGWCLPFHDSTFPKRGGIQVDNTPPTADPLVTAGGTE
ncbi:putative Taurine catabolism dioxygenase TauD [Venustampulla echinocandica]|uniref:Putative Taurine catabolism dioxygenase TauD n=1 Tax=Venustampulla echinocandica TaxID=2656787 RepID=A0A370TED9_9HELO|nr:putative Taurine catabolism dioxygenase TauD [Venustampulla echinocandica]RDL33054.1 putative Taurine catabolism dioxygenase TauD [Venustampulla echinocandica]